MNFVDIMDGASASQPQTGLARLISTKAEEAELFSTPFYNYRVHSAALKSKVMVPLRMTIRNHEVPPMEDWSLHDARRLISSIAVHMPLHASGDVFEVNIVDFLVLEALRVFESDLHEALFRERALVLQERRFQRDGRQDAERAAAERFLEVVPEERRAIARDTVNELFSSESAPPIRFRSSADWP